MSLPPLLRHIYNHGTEEVIRRGKRIFHTSGVSLLDVDHLMEQVRFRVRNDLYQNYYVVTINKFLHPDELSVRCQCPYNLGDICRHEVGALFQLNDIVQSGFFENTDVTYDQKHTVVRLRAVNQNTLRVYTSAEVMDLAQEWVYQNKATITSSENDRIEGDVPDGDAVFHVVLKQNEERFFDTSCRCSENKFPICIHKAALFLQVLKSLGPQYFQTMRNWDEQKNKLLGLYGYSLKDDLTDKFTFTYENGKPFLRVLDTSIKKVNAPAPAPRPSYAPAAIAAPVAPAEVIDNTKHVGIVIDNSVTWYPFVQVSLVAGNKSETENKFLKGIEKLELQQYINPMRFKENERELFPIARKFSPEEILKYLRKNLPFGDFLDDYKQVLKEVPAEETREQVWEYLLPKYQKLLERYSDFPLTFIHSSGKALTTSSMKEVGFGNKKVQPSLHAAKKGDEFTVALQWKIDNTYLDWSEVKMLNSGLMLWEERIYAVADVFAVRMAEEFEPGGTITIAKDKWPAFLESKVMEWSKQIEVTFADELIEHVEEATPALRVYLQEREHSLLLQPVFAYGGVEIKWGFFGNVIQPHEGIVKIIKRNEEAEQNFINMLGHLHTDIHKNNKDHFFHLHSNNVLANNWFFGFADKMKEWNVQLFGHEGLKNLRINVNKPQTRVQVNNGIDWFDASVEIAFGDQTITITDVKKALAQKQNFVRLTDGTLGLLPEEWLKKYSLLIKMGEARGGKLRVKKYHFSILDELLANVNEDKLYAELEEKKERLTDIINNDYGTLQAPEKLQATLRPYQLAGFQWLMFLKESGWGGILADDMGLGKTVQTLAFFQYIKDQDPDAKFMVVCPTTLMYNWENEIRKFTPELTHFIHHGPKRTQQTSVFDKADVTITTYGTMRSDIKLLKDFQFEYIVLDESQAIKNPQSQVAKATLLLNSKNRLALSGTPVQNNTFDLYAQMNFLNPGMLGSREFFMNEFATPIDKFQETEVKQQLRKLIYPFLLRRTKEQVAKDLPEKTESLLFCEMGHEQRKIYDAYRNTYKDTLLGMIDNQGIERSQFHILQGLTKLRQICDSPAILNEKEKFANHSIKTDELMREIMENVGDHKTLVFSQFLGMLALIRDRLEAEKIPYAYFDGSTSSTDREKAIQQFQNNHECRVFLISLKAGGIGLNLTAADYVYIVDPWWNPAVEQQAIDRTHRIGQTKNIFAYRLICKDTIEEKMLVLQDRKRALANELISDDSAILKRLTREDIAYLLS